MKEIVNQIWKQHKEKVAYCLGDSLPSVLELLQLSFPSPLPVGSEEDGAICSNATKIDALLCTPDEVMLYYKVSHMALRVSPNAHKDV